MMHNKSPNRRDALYPKTGKSLEKEALKKLLASVHCRNLKNLSIYAGLSEVSQKCWESSSTSRLLRHTDSLNTESWKSIELRWPFGTLH